MELLLDTGIFPIVLTLAAFQIGRLCQAKWKLAVFNPILIGMVLVAVFLLVSGLEPAAYTAGTAKLTWLITPATVSLAIPMYEQVRALLKSGKAILIGVASGTVSCLLFLLAAGLLLKLEPVLRVSILPKSVTTAIGVPLSTLFGGLGGVTAVSIILTGILANLLGSTLCRVFGITHPIAQGVAFGTAGHVIGTARANELDPLTGAVSSLSLVTAGLLTAVLFPLFAFF